TSSWFSTCWVDITRALLHHETGEVDGFDLPCIAALARDCRTHHGERLPAQIHLALCGREYAVLLVRQHQQEVVAHHGIVLLDEIERRDVACHHFDRHLQEADELLGFEVDDKGGIELVVQGGRR